MPQRSSTKQVVQLADEKSWKKKIIDPPKFVAVGDITGRSVELTISRRKRSHTSVGRHFRDAPTILQQFEEHDIALAVNPVTPPKNNYSAAGCSLEPLSPSCSSLSTSFANAFALSTVRLKCYNGAKSSSTTSSTEPCASNASLVSRSLGSLGRNSTYFWTTQIEPKSV